MKTKNEPDPPQRITDHVRTYPKIQVTLTQELLDLVDEKARELSRDGERNRSLAIRELIRAGIAKKPDHSP